MERNRRTIRLQGYDYAAVGAYFVTVCTHGRWCLFGEVVDEEMQLSSAGKMVEEVWQALPKRSPAIQTDEFVVMPNHVHGIVMINDNDSTNTDSTVNTPRVVGATLVVARPTVGDVMSAFKSITTTQYIHGVKTNQWTPFNGKLWQRNYYEHIIRNDEDLNRVREYILLNPLKWNLDKENPINN